MKIPAATFICSLSLLGSAQAGMTVITLSEIAKTRLEVLSFFILT